MKSYEYRHVVAFEETNLVGNVYYVNHLRWQGRCREMFLREHAPDVLEQLASGLVLSTVRCTCEYFSELTAFEEITVRMRLGELRQNRLTLVFEYVRGSNGREQTIARGEQQIACLRREASGPVPVPIPQSLREALRAYSDVRAQ